MHGIFTNIYLHLPYKSTKSQVNISYMDPMGVRLRSPDQVTLQEAAMPMYRWKHRYLGVTLFVLFCSSSDKQILLKRMMKLDMVRPPPQKKNIVRGAKNNKKLKPPPWNSPKFMKCFDKSSTIFQWQSCSCFLGCYYTIGDGWPTPSIW